MNNPHVNLLENNVKNMLLFFATVDSLFYVFLVYLSSYC